jgi:hypothetical protein
MSENSTVVVHDQNIESKSLESKSMESKSMESKSLESKIDRNISNHNSENSNSTSDLTPLDNKYDLEDEPHQPPSVSQSNIKRLANTIHHILRSTPLMRPPSFTLHTRSNYTKIKNFVHNITKVWLNRENIKMLMAEYSAISS